jgi:uncharacterized protein
MEARLLFEERGLRTFVLIFSTGDEAISGLTAFAREKRLAASHFTAIGAFREATLGYFDWEKKAYQKNPVREQVEVVALLGDIALAEDGSPKVHVHVVLGRRDSSAVGGHLIEGQVRPTLEVTLVETPQHLRRKHDPESGLALIRL